MGNQSSCLHCGGMEASSSSSSSVAGAGANGGIRVITSEDEKPGGNTKERKSSISNDSATAHRHIHERGGRMDRQASAAVLRHEQAIALLLQHGDMSRATYSYGRSTSRPQLVISAHVPSKQHLDLPRSASAQSHVAAALADDESLSLHPQKSLARKTKGTDSCHNLIESNRFVLVHGGGFGAWCWYKSIALLEEAGFMTTALDLSGSGIDSTNPNEISSLEQYSRPLCEFLEKLPEGEKVNLVGHSFGGSCISYAMEHYPHKIAKAIFVAAFMVKNGQSALDVFSSHGVASSIELLQNSQVFVYANGKTHPPTSIELNKTQMKEMFFNRTSSKDMTLSVLSIRPVPFAPFAEKLSLSKEKYGNVRRFFIHTMDDHIFTSTMQAQMVDSNPPEKVLRLKGSDHCPFFSKPQSLHSLFVEIAQMEDTKLSKFYIKKVQYA